MQTAQRKRSPGNLAESPSRAYACILEEQNVHEDIRRPGHTPVQRVMYTTAVWTILSNKVNNLVRAREKYQTSSPVPLLFLSASSAPPLTPMSADGSWSCAAACSSCFRLSSSRSLISSSCLIHSARQKTFVAGRRPCCRRAPVTAGSICAATLRYPISRSSADATPTA